MCDLSFVEAFTGAGFVQLIRGLGFILHVNIAMRELATLAILASPSLYPILAHLCFELCAIDIPNLSLLLSFGL